MKKFFTLLAAAAVCLSASALQKVPVRLAPMQPVAVNNAAVQQAVKSGQVQTLTLPNTTMQKMQGTDNNEWASLASLNGPVVEQLSFGNGQPTFEELPYYFGYLTIQGTDTGNQNKFVQGYLIWPAKCALDYSVWKKNDKNQATEVDPALAEAKYGADWDKAMTYEEYTTASGNTILPFVDNLYYGFASLISDALGGTMTWGQKDVKYLVKNCTVGNDIQLDGSYVDWKSFDPETNDCEFDWTIVYLNSETGAQAGTANVSVSGEPTILGFSDLSWDTIGQAHIFNGGVQNQGGEWTWAWGDAYGENTRLNYYYLCFCDQTMTYQGQNSQTGEEVFGYEDDTLPEGGQPLGAIADPYEFTFAAGAIWAPADKEKGYYGLWTMPMYDLVNEGTQADPDFVYKGPACEPYKLVAYINAGPGGQDGFHMVWKGYSQGPEPEKTFLGIGDKEKGLNFSLQTGMTNGHTIVGSFTDDIYYHGTPEAWTKDITMIPAKADIEADAVAAGATAVKSVVSDAPVVSQSFYNLQGQRIDQPQHGIYIVRSVKADGTVSASKVAK